MRFRVFIRFGIAVSVAADMYLLRIQLPANLFHVSDFHGIARYSPHVKEQVGYLGKDTLGVPFHGAG